MLRHFLLLLLLATPSAAADKTLENVMREVLRDLGGMQEQMKSLQTTLEAKLAGVDQANADRSRTAAEQSKASIAALGDRFEKTFQDQKEQQDRTLATLAGFKAELQAVSSDVRTFREAISELTSSMAKMSAQMTDLKGVVKEALTPKAEPPKPELTCTDLFTAADNDRRGGRFELAQTEFTEYVGKCPDKEDADNALYYIGNIYYFNRVYEDAIKAFDLLKSTYPESKRSPDALWYSGDSLLKLGRTVEAKRVFADLVKRFPTSPFAKQIPVIR